MIMAVKQKECRMSEKITGEQLEASAGMKSKTFDVCAECGSMVDTEEHHGISLDGEKYCCSDCIDDVIRLDSIKYSTGWWGASAKHGKDFDTITVEAVAVSQQAALKRAKDYAEMTNEGVNAYVEVN
jgi:hypothetical protein